MCATDFTESFAVLRGIEAEGTLHVSAEVCRRGEIEHVRYLHDCQRLVTQQMADVERSVAVYPVVGRVAADFFRQFREVFRRDTEGIGIISHFPVLAVGAALKHVDEAAHQYGGLSGDSGLVVNGRMKVEEIEYGRLYGVHQLFAVEFVAGLVQPIVDPAEIAFAYEALLSIEPHYRIEEERQLAFYAVIALGRTQSYERGGNVYYLDCEVFRWLYVVQQGAFAHYHQVALVQFKLLSVEVETAAAAHTQRVCEIIDEAVCADAVESGLDYYVVESFHVQI